MPGWETIGAALGGLALGVTLGALWVRRASGARARERVELSARLRRVVVPVLERRADVLGIPAAERGDEARGTVELVLALAQVIKTQEETVDLPFGDTVEVERGGLDTTRNEKQPRPSPASPRS